MQYSAPERAPGVDGQRDTRDDLRHDEISAFQYQAASLSSVTLEEPIDPWDAADVMRHRKKTDAAVMSRKKMQQWRAAVQEERPSLTTLRTDVTLPFRTRFGRSVTAARASVATRARPIRQRSHIRPRSSCRRCTRVYTPFTLAHTARSL